jgi:hypothetical protein
MKLVVFVLVLLSTFLRRDTACAQSEPLVLIGGGAANTWVDSLTVFTVDDIERMTDGDSTTGFTHTSLFGADVPHYISGVQERFDFDVSRFASISQIVFTWTGTHQWNSGVLNPFPSLRLGPQPTIPLLRIDFGSTTDATIRSGSLALAGANLTRSLRPGLASIWVSTDFGSSTSPEWQFISVETLEVTATLTGVPIAVNSISWGAIKSLYR